jgi:hypothetical protein
MLVTDGGATIWIRLVSGACMVRGFAPSGSPLPAPGTPGRAIYTILTGVAAPLSVAVTGDCRAAT